MALKVLDFAWFQRRVRDPARSTAFYEDALGFEPFDSGLLRLGRQSIEFIVDGKRETGADYAQGMVDTGFQHLAIVTSDMSAAFQRLQTFAPKAVSRGGPVRLPESAGGVTAFKFLDPDGHPLELIEFPAGTGDPQWQQRGTVGPTLGIDHSAIVVSSLEKSIAFYRDELGFEVVAQQRNKGPTQVRLDGIDGVEVDVVALRPGASATPHLELLCYARPAAGRREGTDCMVWNADDTEGGSLMRHVTDPDGHRHLLIPLR